MAAKRFTLVLCLLQLLLVHSQIEHFQCDADSEQPTATVQWNSALHLSKSFEFTTSSQSIIVFKTEGTNTIQHQYQYRKGMHGMGGYWASKDKGITPKILYCPSMKRWITETLRDRSVTTIKIGEETIVNGPIRMQPYPHKVIFEFEDTDRHHQFTFKDTDKNTHSVNIGPNHYYIRPDIEWFCFQTKSTIPSPVLEHLIENALHGTGETVTINGYTVPSRHMIAPPEMPIIPKTSVSKSVSKSGTVSGTVSKSESVRRKFECPISEAEMVKDPSNEQFWKQWELHLPTDEDKQNVVSDIFNLDKKNTRLIRLCTEYYDALLDFAMKMLAANELLFVTGVEQMREKAAEGKLIQMRKKMTDIFDVFIGERSCSYTEINFAGALKTKFIKAKAIKDKSDIEWAGEKDPYEGIWKKLYDGQRTLIKLGVAMEFAKEEVYTTKFEGRIKKAQKAMTKKTKEGVFSRASKKTKEWLSKSKDRVTPKKTVHTESAASTPKTDTISIGSRPMVQLGHPARNEITFTFSDTTKQSHSIIFSPVDKGHYSMKISIGSKQWTLHYITKGGSMGFEWRCDDERPIDTAKLVGLIVQALGKNPPEEVKINGISAAKKALTEYDNVYYDMYEFYDESPNEYHQKIADYSINNGYAYKYNDMIWVFFVMNGIWILVVLCLFCAIFSIMCGVITYLGAQFTKQNAKGNEYVAIAQNNNDIV